MEDNALIEKFKSGDEEGFEMLVKKYQNRVNNIIDSLLGTGRYSDDIAQEVFIKVYKNLGSFKKKAAFSTWLYRVAVNTSGDFLRWRTRRREISFEERAADGVSLTEARERRPDEEAAARERERLIAAALETLSFAHRTVILLHDFEGLSHREIARIMRCSEGTIWSRLYYGREKLRRRLAKYFSNDK